MVIDAAKGIESQTRKLFEVCRQRGIPIFTFINKLDRPSRDLLGLLDEIETVLGIDAVAMNWPLGTGQEFRGIFDRRQKQVHLFERTPGGAFRAPVTVAGIGDSIVQEAMSPDAYRQCCDELEMLEGAGTEYDPEALQAAKQTPVYFGSAINNFGVQAFLDSFILESPAPSSRTCGSVTVKPDDPDFSGFVFKIQANMDPKHRDRIAFLRIVSGEFQRDMSVKIVRTGKSIRLSSTHKLFGRDRETVDQAYAGDVIGIVGHPDLRIGDTLATRLNASFDAIPTFAPEVFSFLHCVNTERMKQYRDGVDQLAKEGVVQVLYRIDAPVRVPMMAAVGVLQFDVVRFRLETEYGVQTRLESAPYAKLRWLGEPAQAETLRSAPLPTGVHLYCDTHERPALLFPSTWTLRYFTEQFPQVHLIEAFGAVNLDAEE